LREKGTANLRNDCGTNGETRSSALWGKRSSGSRTRALWAKNGRGAAAVLALVVAFAAPIAAPAASGSGNRADAYVPGDLLAAAQAHPNRTFAVIVQGEAGRTSREVAARVARVRAQNPGRARGVKRQFRSVNGVSARITGQQLLELADRSDVLSITRDGRMKLAAYSNTAPWPQAAGVNGFWNPSSSGAATSAQAPTIAIVDSGIQANRADFAPGQIAAQVNMTELLPNAPGDGRGHGTFVGSIAAGSASGKAGAAAGAKLVSIDVMDDAGMARTSDVIAAADWISANRARYNIRVANFSLHSTVPASFMFDPLDRAVEKLWFSGIVVVAAAGNYAQDGVASGVPYAPGNDPFVITVGAADIKNTSSPADDAAAPWSAYGYTADGFAKPELGAPGRYMVGAVPVTSTMALERPDRIVSPGYMWMSGTSFAAPVVAGAAANLLARHPGWTPDQVKGALMVSARQSTDKVNALGVGTVHAASADKVTDPPNPNLALNRFLVADPNGGATPVFDAASWASVAQADASWASASWASASWASASWSSASWASASWASASWASASWAAQATADASWASASWASASWASASWASASWVS
jgi:serine protease AprX